MDKDRYLEPGPIFNHKVLRSISIPPCLPIPGLVPRYEYQAIYAQYTTNLALGLRFSGVKGSPYALSLGPPIYVVGQPESQVDLILIHEEIIMQGPYTHYSA